MDALSDGEMLGKRIKKEEATNEGKLSRTWDLGIYTENNIL